MQIRREQISALEQYQLDSFEHDLLGHLKQYSPRHCAVIGDEGLRQVVRLGATNATSYGLTQRDTTRLYVELMFMFGSHFDTDPQHSWAAEALNDPLVSDPLFRASALYQNMTAYLNEVSGPKREYGVAAMHATRRMMKDDLETPPDLRGEILRRLHQVHPRKCAWLGDERLQMIADKGLAVADMHQVTSPRGRALLAILTFAIGHKYFVDPLFPWIESTLKDRLVSDPNLRAKRLEGKCLVYLDRVLLGLEQG